MLRRTDFFLWWHTVLPVHLSLRHGEGRVGGQDRGRRHISHLPHAVISSILSSPVFSSPLLSSLVSSRPCVGVAQETSSWATSLECCLQSALELILIIPPPHNNPGLSALLLINTDVKRISVYRCIWMYVTTPWQRAKPHLFLSLYVLLSQWLHGSNCRSRLNCP